MHALAARGLNTVWIDCNLSGSPSYSRPHWWVEVPSDDPRNTHYQCKRCPVSTLVRKDRVDSDGRRVFPSGWLLR